MKTTSQSYLRGLALLAGAALFFASSPLLRAHDGEDHEDADKPTTVAAAFEQVHHLHTTLAEQVKGKNLKPVHETAEELAETFNLLPGLSKDLPADKLKRVEGAVKNLAKALDALHDAADAGNQAGAEKQLGVVESLLKVVSAQYAAQAEHKH
ncbi:MAG: hypothetical protein HY302_06625 [Opitutae bacterium]|nr:hypothetical protein [Opitutae bacterium]